MSKVNDNVNKIATKALNKAETLMKKIFDLAEDLREPKNNLTPFNKEVRKYVGITYKEYEGVEYQLDLILPKEDLPDGKKFPVIYFIPGGGWLTGRNHLRHGIATLWATMGAAVVLVHHRTSPQYVFPAHLVDVIDGINFLETISDKFKLDLDKVYVGGDSSGGHLALCLGCAKDSEEYCEKMQLPKLNVKFHKLILISGAFSFLVMYHIPFTHNLIVKHFSGVKTRNEFKKYKFFKEANPYNYISPTFSECFVLGGLMDFLCSYEAERLNKILKKNNVKSTLYVGHNPFNSGHDFSLRINFPPARRAMRATMTWYYENIKELGIDQSEGYQRVINFLYNYRIVIKPLRVVDKAERKLKKAEQKLQQKNDSKKLNKALEKAKQNLKNAEGKAAIMQKKVDAKLAKREIKKAA